MNERDRQRRAELDAGRQDVAAVAMWVAEQPTAERPSAGLDDPRAAALLSELLGYVADRYDRLTPDVRAGTRRLCRDVLGRSMDRPTVRRTRRR